jgi:hypothetical protein
VDLKELIEHPRRGTEVAHQWVIQERLQGELAIAARTLACAMRVTS